MNAARRILVFTDWLRGQPTTLTSELLGGARRLADELGGEVGALLLGDDAGAQDLVACGADEVFTVTPAPDSQIDVEACLSALESASKRFSPAVVLIPHTAMGADIAPRLAFRLETGGAMGCVNVAWSDNQFAFTRPRQGGIAREVLFIKTEPAIATVRAGCHDAAIRNAQRTGRITPLACDLARTRRTHLIERRHETATGALRLEDARVIVAGGRGLNGPEGFRVLEALAGALGGAVGASRVPCDLGWCSRSLQIGLTGRTVTPDLYIAVGISGAGHHMAGCGNSKAIVAVNTDAAAAIFREARYGIVGDYQKVVPALIEELRKGRNDHGV